MTNEIYKSCDSMETCVTCYARLLIDTIELSAEEFSSAVGLEPTRLSLVDSNQFDLIGPGLKLKEAKWIVSSANRVASVDIRDHLDWLLALLNPCSSALQTLQERAGVKMVLDCVMFFRGGGVPKLRPDQMLAIADLNLVLSFDFYFLREPEGDEDGEEMDG